MKKGGECGVFCEVLGSTPRAAMLEFFLESRSLDYGIGDVAKQISLTKPTAYSTAKELEKEGIITKSRNVGKTQLYHLNAQSKKAKILISMFNSVIHTISEEYQQKNRKRNN